MKDVKWIINRVKAMQLKEIFWRLTQKKLQKCEKKIYYLNMDVTEIPLTSELVKLRIDVDKLSINWENCDWTPFLELDIFGIFSYEKYKMSWDAGFQTPNIWPRNMYSSTIKISQRVDIGDIRTNWELSRHYQLAAMAKSYYCTRDERYLFEFKEIFNSWNSHNLFLHGVEWTSMMELAIRVNSWVYAYAFLYKAGVREPVIDRIEHGILVMVDYILKHYARYSSANNHLIVEMYAVALVGILTDYKPWKDKALNILNDELEKQNHLDGVNKEMSLHYQSFIMEAYGLLWLVMKKNKILIPELWKNYLSSMSEFVSDSTDCFGKTIEFGDSDEGKILDLCGKVSNHYHYVLNLLGCLLEVDYTDYEWNENLKWIVPRELQNTIRPKYVPDLICTRKDGGYTFLRNKEQSILIGIDHASLGFGTLAAHGHADALSFQMNVCGVPFFIDSGTYNYHITPYDRNYFRSTVAHNTVMIDMKEQSEMLGPFIWGKRAEISLDKTCITEDSVIIKASCKGDAGEHTRIFEFNKVDKLIIKDYTSGIGKAYYHIGPDVKYSVAGDLIYLKSENSEIILKHDSINLEVEKAAYSEAYNKMSYSTCFVMTFEKFLTTSIILNKQNELQ